MYICGVLVYLYNIFLGSPVAGCPVADRCVIGFLTRS